MNKEDDSVKRILLLLLSAILLFSLCSCQTDFSRPTDYVFDTKNGARKYTLDLSGINLPGTSKTFVFEVTNSAIGEKAYTLTALIEGTLPLICEFEDTSTATVESSVSKTIGRNETHRYKLTVSWPAEENSYLYAGGTASITVEGFAE